MSWRFDAGQVADTDHRRLVTPNLWVDGQDPLNVGEAPRVVEVRHEVGALQALALRRGLLRDEGVIAAEAAERERELV